MEKASPAWIVRGVVVVASLAVAVRVVQRLRHKPPNPFAADTRRPPEPLPETEAAWEELERRKQRIVKNIYRPSKVPAGLDAIVIGSGIGGLATAALLARAGQTVLVLEQHDQAGGCCHSFRDKGFKFDPGIHYVGDLDERAVTGFLVHQLTEGQLQWASLEEEYDVVLLQRSDGSVRRVPITARRRNEVLAEHFPAETEALQKWQKALKEGHAAMRTIVMLKVLPKLLARLLLWLPVVGAPLRQSLRIIGTTTHAVLEGLTSDPELRAVLSWCWGDYGVPPQHSSFAIHSAVVNHYERGAYYPVGGSDHIAYTIIPTIVNAGGAVLVNARVGSILVEGGKAVGVRLEADGCEIFAPTVISDAGLHNTLQRLLPSPYRRDLTAKYPHSASFLSLFIGLRGSAEELQLQKSQFWYYSGAEAAASLGAFLEAGPAAAEDTGFPFLFISFPSAKDPLERRFQPGTATCTVLTLTPYSWFEQFKAEPPGQRSEEYEELKARLGRAMWRQVCVLFPQLKDRVEYFSVGSPLTNEHYLAAAEGAPYGLDHALPRFGLESLLALRPDCCGVPGLWLTGQDVLLCGFSGALLGGLLTAGAVLGRNLYGDLLALKAKCQPRAHEKR